MANTRKSRKRQLQMWPVKWRGTFIDVGTETFWAESAEHARQQFEDLYPHREIVRVGKPIVLKPLK